MAAKMIFHLLNLTDSKFLSYSVHVLMFNSSGVDLYVSYMYRCIV